mgnify:CR=1 FL=1
MLFRSNTDRLRRDLAEMGVFDEQMSVYLLYKLREFRKMGFSGFEGRQYSLFPSFMDEMARAADMQMLVTLLAFKYMAYGSITPESIPDTPCDESERRQVFFGTALGIPTFFVRKNSRNMLLQKLISRTGGTRSSHRYPGYLRVHNNEYRRALLSVIREDGADLIEMTGVGATIDDLARRLDDDRLSAFHKVGSEVSRLAGSRSPMGMDAKEFNLAAERYCRENLREHHISEALDIVSESCRSLDTEDGSLDEECRRGLRSILHGESAESFIGRARDEIVNEGADIVTLRKSINLMLLVAGRDERGFASETAGSGSRYDTASVYRAQ